MTYQEERDQFVGRMVKEGLTVTGARKLLSLADRLQKYAELSCSSERADRDRVPCPTKRFRPTRLGGACLCDDGGSLETIRPAHCLKCQHRWPWRVCYGSTPNISGEETIRCPKCDSREVSAGPHEQHHGDVPRHIVSEARAEEEVDRICAAAGDGFSPIFGGDPRGAVLKIKVPSGFSDSWANDGGVCVPARGFTPAQAKRMGW